MVGLRGSNVVFNSVPNKSLINPNRNTSDSFVQKFNGLLNSLNAEIKTLIPSIFLFASIIA